MDTALPANRQFPKWILPALVTGCGCSHSGSPQNYLRQYVAIPESTAHFVVCSRAGCEETAEVKLNSRHWQQLTRIFEPPPTASARERERIASAVAAFESLVGTQAGTFDDRPAGEGVFRPTRQLDCVAETANTTVYLLLLQQRGLIRWHRVEYPKHRGLLQLQAPHNTAVITDRTSGETFAIDSYFHTNGAAPEIVPLETWMAGFRPPD